jgi:glycosyltransferase involved in cell wall biosynthesis
MPKTLSFCTTCQNRLWQLKETLPQNLLSISDEHEIVLVDYGSTDGLRNWIWSNYRNYIENKKLVFFEVENEVRWNVARAKNLAHRLASGDYLFNLDADNFVMPSDISIIEKSRGLKLHCWQFSGSLPDGSYGRIGIPKKVFNEIGGYDETLLPMGGQDWDLLRRLESIQKRVRLSPPARSAIPNSSYDKVKELIHPDADEKKSVEAYDLLNSLNKGISKFKLETEGPIRVGGGFSYRGLFNGKIVNINGFNEIRYESE